MSTRPAKNESSFDRRVVTSSTALVGLSSILTSSSSLGGVTGRGKFSKSGFCASDVLGLVPNVKIPGLDAPCVDSPNRGAASFSGEVEGAPNLKANENAGFGSFDASFCTITGGLADSPGDGVEVDCSRVNGFMLSVELVALKSRGGAPDEVSNGNVDGVDPFCSEAVAAGPGPIIEVTEGTDAVETSVDSVAELWDGKSPNKLGGGRALGGGGNEVFNGFPPNGIGVGTGAGSTFAKGTGRIDVIREGIVEAAATGGTGEGGTDWVDPTEVSIKPFVPVERGAGSDVAGGVG